MNQLNALSNRVQYYGPAPSNKLTMKPASEQSTRIIGECSNTCLMELGTNRTVTRSTDAHATSRSNTEGIQRSCLAIVYSLRPSP
jgi:hypothetical protein